MTALTDQDFILASAAARRFAIDILQQGMPINRQPTKDPATGSLVIGHGRRLDLWPLGDEEALYMLRQQVLLADRELGPRMLELMATNPSVTPERMGVLTVLASLIGPGPVKDWEPLWKALKAGDFEEAATEIMVCNYARLVNDTLHHKRLVVKLVGALLKQDIEVKE